MRGLTLTIENGVVVDVAAESGLDAALAEMDAAGTPGRHFREFALGFTTRCWPSRTASRGCPTTVTAPGWYGSRWGTTRSWEEP